MRHRDRVGVRAGYREFRTWYDGSGGQLFSKSLRGFTTYKLEMAGHEGWLLSLCLLLVPFLILWGMLQVFLPAKPAALSRGAATT